MINEKNFAERSALFAQLSAFAYEEPEKGTKVFNKLGFKSIFLSKADAEAYVLYNDNDIVVACRGTQPNQWSDISADCSIDLVKPLDGEGKVHVGFKSYVDKLWDEIYQSVLSVRTNSQRVWVTGHSLGAAMATLIARRLLIDTSIPTPSALFTYGSPRVGNSAYVSEFNDKLIHHRWVNDGDIVTKVPLPIIYKHCGTMHHIGSDGIITPDMQKKQRIITIIKMVFGFWSALWSKLFGDAKDHSIDVYAQRLQFWSLTYEE